jgi:signal transduction histidine kinase
VTVRSAEPEELAWREVLLRRLLVALTPIVVAAVIMAVLATHGRNRAVFALILLPVALQVAALLSPHWSYRLRAQILIAPLAAATYLAYFLTAFKGNASVVAACAVVLTGLLFDRRSMGWMLVALLVAPIGAAAMMISGALTIDDRVDLSTLHALPWIRTTFVAAATWGLLGLAITFVVQRIEGALAKTRQTLLELREEAARRQKAEAERRAAEDAALEAQKMELVGRLAAGVAHDFNNLLGVVGGWAELALDEMAVPGERAQAREGVESAIQHGRALTRQLLALARRDARVVSRVCLEESAKLAVRALSRVLPAGVELSFAPGESVHVDADETEIQQILFNLVLNARDAMPQGGRIEVTSGIANTDHALEVVAGTLAPGRWAFLRVQDAGTGIEPALRQKIFELFFTTKPVGLGTGLGLATVLRIAQTSAGGIALDSTPGRGSTFTLYLPCAG